MVRLANRSLGTGAVWYGVVVLTSEHECSWALISGAGVGSTIGAFIVKDLARLQGLRPVCSVCAFIKQKALIMTEGRYRLARRICRDQPSYHWGPKLVSGNTANYYEFLTY